MTPLDKMRAEYVRQIIEAVCDRNNDPVTVTGLVDNLVAEWGAKAYMEGRSHMADRIKRCADEWRGATG